MLPIKMGSASMSAMRESSERPLGREMMTSHKGAPSCGSSLTSLPPDRPTITPFGAMVGLLLPRRVKTGAG